MEGTSNVMEGWDGMRWKEEKKEILRLWASEVRTKCNLAFIRWQKTSDMKNYHSEWKWMKKSMILHSFHPHTLPSLPHEVHAHGNPSPWGRGPGLFFPSFSAIIFKSDLLTCPDTVAWKRLRFLRLGHSSRAILWFREMAVHAHCRSQGCP